MGIDLTLRRLRSDLEASESRYALLRTANSKLARRTGELENLLREAALYCPETLKEQIDDQLKKYDFLYQWLYQWQKKQQEEHHHDSSSTSKGPRGNEERR